MKNLKTIVAILGMLNFCSCKTQGEHSTIQEEITEESSLEESYLEMLPLAPGNHEEIVARKLQHENFAKLREKTITAYENKCKDHAQTYRNLQKQLQKGPAFAFYLDMASKADSFCASAIGVIRRDLELFKKDSQELLQSLIAFSGGSQANLIDESKYESSGARIRVLAMTENFYLALFENEKQGYWGGIPLSNEEFVFRLFKKFVVNIPLSASDSSNANVNHMFQVSYAPYFSQDKKFANQALEKNRQWLKRGETLSDPALTGISLNAVTDFNLIQKIISSGMKFQSYAPSISSLYAKGPWYDAGLNTVFIRCWDERKGWFTNTLCSDPQDVIKVIEES